MKIITQMLLYGTDTQDLTVKKKIYCCLLDHTVKQALQSHPQKLNLKNLLAGRTKTLSFRQDLLPLSGIAEAVNGEEKETSGRVRVKMQIIFCAKIKYPLSLLHLKGWTHFSLCM